MSKRKPLTEADVLRIIKRDECFAINPLMHRNRAKASLLNSMYKRGLLSRVVYKLNHIQYYAQKDNP